MSGFKNRGKSGAKITNDSHLMILDKSMGE